MLSNCEYFFRSENLLLLLVEFLDENELIHFTQVNSEIHRFSQKNSKLQIKLMKI